MMVFPVAQPPHSVDVKVGATTESWAPSAGDRTDVRTAMDALVAWANDAGRAWSGSLTFSWSWTDDAAGGGLPYLVATAVFQLRCTGTNPLYWPTSYGTAALSVAATAAPAGTWAPERGQLAVSNWFRNLAVGGDAGGTGAARAGVPGRAAIQPTITAIANHLAVARLNGLLVADSARVVQVWQVHEATWRTVLLGPPERAVAGRGFYRMTFAAWGQ